MATGSDDGHTIVTNLVSYRHEVLPRNSEEEVKHVLFLDRFDCLLSVSVGGMLTFYAIGNSKLKNKILLEKQYMTESMTKNLEPFPVTAVKFDKDKQMIVLGDEFGNIQGWNIDKFL